jgi:hypothetical protein
MDGYRSAVDGTEPQQVCSLGERLVECETTSRSCEGIEINGCGPVYCIDDSSCGGTTFLESSVFC